MSQLCRSLGKARSSEKRQRSDRMSSCVPDCRREQGPHAAHVPTRRCTHAHTCTRMRAHRDTCACTHTHMQTHMHTRAHTETHMHTEVHTCTPRRTHAHTCAHTGTCTHTRTETHTWTHMHMHTDTHAHSQVHTQRLTPPLSGSGGEGPGSLHPAPHPGSCSFVCPVVLAQGDPEEERLLKVPQAPLM